MKLLKEYLQKFLKIIHETFYDGILRFVFEGIRERVSERIPGVISVGSHKATLKEIQGRFFNSILREIF